ncbi:hypothetical protein BD324DRAFT_629622 [Kockovaella imperatae]|uniref:F-box domain-containing protein n=1 Tax=Kockovaella imperatae TaxID=4999 RepID=A0A1Y1UD24_9TREE|nr:hypothetical protein BD324DRAFT_629622 [Kockovaella imperatae]ORX35951.1 hypothetical protein BD324DRAFT_629622 [Kockovaella imperatae]
MPTSDSAHHYHVGVEQMKKKEYAAAYASFDKAIMLSRVKSLATFDMRVYAMSRMGSGWINSALERAQKNCEEFDNDVNSWKTWLRLADVLYSKGEFHAADGALNDAVKRMDKLSSAARRANALEIIEKLRDKVRTAYREKQLARKLNAQQVIEEQNKAEKRKRDALRARMNHIKMLPRDTLLMIAEVAVGANPNIGVVMAGVCREWRRTMTPCPQLWKRLVLGSRRPVDKAMLWHQRSGGRLNELSFSETFDASNHVAIAAALRDSLASIKSLSLAETTERLDPYRGRLKSIERLTGKSNNRFGPYLEFGFIHPSTTTLRSLSLQTGRLCVSSNFFGILVPGAAVPGPVLDNIIKHLSTLRSVEMENCEVLGDVFNGTFAMCSRASLFQHLKQAEICKFNAVSWTSYGPVQAPPMLPPGVQAPPNLGRIDLPQLKTYEETAANCQLEGPLFEAIHVPNLTSLHLFDLRSGAQSDALSQLRAPGLVHALPNLISLDIGKSALDQAQLLIVLKDLKSLRFLNLSFCGINNAFLDAIQLKDELSDADQILPHLTALSIAGHETVTTGAVRDFLNSRLPISERIPKRVEKPLAKGPSMFKPTAPKRVIPASQQSLGGSSQRVPATQVKSSSIHSIALSTQPPSSFALSQDPDSLPVNPRIDWLNLDACESIESTAVELWRSRTRFISNWLGVPDYDRIRGKGKWAWDADWTEDCGRGTDLGCHLRPVPGRQGAFEVWHTCRSGWTSLPEDEDSGDSVAAKGKKSADRKKGWHQMPKNVSSTASTLDDAL